jgi:hypothetical protein
LALDDGDMNEGEEVLQGYRKQKGPGGMGLVVAWKSTCVRGFQKLKVPLANGEIAFGPEVVNKYMNYVQQLSVSPLDNGKLKVGVGQSKPFTVTGIGAEGTGNIDLSTRFECLALSIREGGHATARLNRTMSKLEIEGLKGGVTDLKMLLPGPTSRLAHQFPDVEGQAPIEVDEPAGEVSWSKTRSFQFYNNDWNATLGASVTTTTGRLIRCESQEGGSLLVLYCSVPPADGNPPPVDTYTVTMRVSGVTPRNPNTGPGPDYEQVVMGQFSKDPMVEGGKDGGTFVKVLQIPRGTVQHNLEFDLLVYFKHKQGKEPPRLWASAGVFRFSIRR